MNYLALAVALVVLAFALAFIGLIRLERAERMLEAIKNDLARDYKALRRWNRTRWSGRESAQPRNPSTLIGEPAYVISKAQLLAQINACSVRLTTGANPHIPEKTQAQIREELQTLLKEIEYFGGAR